MVVEKTTNQPPLEFSRMKTIPLMMAGTQKFCTQGVIYTVNSQYVHEQRDRENKFHKLQI